jgi:diaminopimelate decarboxylase
MDPKKIHLHGNAKSERELTEALDARIGDIVVDNFDDLDKLDRLASAERPQPGPAAHHARRGRRHPRGDLDRAGRLEVRLRPRRGARGDRPRRAQRQLTLTGLHAHIGSQLLALQPFRLAVAAMASLGHFTTVNLGGGLGVAYHRAEEAPRVADYARAKVEAVTSTSAAT